MGEPWSGLSASPDTLALPQEMNLVFPSQLVDRLGSPQRLHRHHRLELGAVVPSFPIHSPPPVL